MKNIFILICLLFMCTVGYSQTPSLYIEIKSAPNLTITTDSNQVFYSEPGLYNRTYKYSFVNNSITDTLIVKIEESSSRTFWHRIFPGQSLNRAEIYWAKGITFYVYFASGGTSGNTIRGELFEHS